MNKASIAIHRCSNAAADRRRIPPAYAGYYNDIRTHWSLDKDAPVHKFTPDPWAGFIATIQRGHRCIGHSLAAKIYARVLVLIDKMKGKRAR